MEETESVPIYWFTPQVCAMAPVQVWVAGTQLPALQVARQQSAGVGHWCGSGHLTSRLNACAPTHPFIKPLTE